jgi:hypothetical protein
MNASLDWSDAASPALVGLSALPIFIIRIVKAIVVEALVWVQDHICRIAHP